MPMQGLYDTAAFDEFCRARRKAMSSIANQADRAVQVCDVMATAWEMASLIQTRTKAEIDFRDHSCQEQILRYTHFELITRAEKRTKYAVRLDQAPACAYVRLLEICHGRISRLADFLPRPWRPFKLHRTPQQLLLNFGEDLFDRAELPSSTKLGTSLSGR